MMPVSIVIPFHNGEPFLRQALESALAQQFEKFEIILCDNASTDNSAESVADLIKHHRVRYVYFDDKISMPLNFNRALGLAHGSFIRFLCHDDVLSPNCLSETFRIMTEHPTVVIVTSYEKTFGDHTYIRALESIKKCGLVPGPEARRSLLHRGNWIGGPTAVTLRRSALDERLFPETLSCSFDVAAWLRLLKAGDAFVVPEFLFSSRIHSGQATNHCMKVGFKSDWRKILQHEFRTQKLSLQNSVPLGLSWIKSFLGRI